MPRLIERPTIVEAAGESTVELFSWLVWCHPDYQIAEAREWITRQIEAFREGTEFQFVIVSESSGFLGGCGLSDLNPVHRLAEKAGAERKGIVRSRLLLHDRFHDAVLHSIIRSSFSTSR
jgi:RimJ/RimL family protein N-acetyltransferase